MDPKNVKVLDDTKKQPRIAFFLGAAMALGWELGYDDLDTLGKHTKSLVECFDVLDAMKSAKSDSRVAQALICIGKKRDQEQTAARVGR